MKQFALIVLLVLAVGVLTAQTAGPAAIDLSGLSRPDLELLCHNLYGRVDELKEELTGATEKLQRMQSENADLKREVEDYARRGAGQDNQAAAPGAPAPPEKPAGAAGDKATIHNKLRRLIDAGEPVRARLMEAERRTAVTGSGPIMMRHPGLTDVGLALQNAQGRYVADIDVVGLNLGAAGRLGACEVFQVVDQNNMIVRFSGDELAWVSGFNTAGMADGYVGNFDGIFEIKSNTQYLAAGHVRTTVFKLTPMGVEAWVERDEQTHLLLVKANHP